MIHVTDIEMTYRTRIQLRDGRVVRPLNPYFMGPMPDDLVASGSRPGRWLAAVTADDRWLDPLPFDHPSRVGRRAIEFLSSEEIVSIRIVGEFSEWPAEIATRASFEVALWEGFDDD